VTFLRPSTSFDKESYENLNNLVNSIQRVVWENKVPSGIIKDLKKLLRMCKAASEIHQSHGQCAGGEHAKIEKKITAIESFAKNLSREYETDVVDENDVEGPSCGGKSG
jgi:trimethylamine:corrinoid methyltransferase-like protein